MKHTFYFLTIILAISIFASCNSGNNEKKAAVTEVGDNKTDSSYKILGRQVFANTCAVCHSKPDNLKTPSIEALAAMQPRIILNALNNGKMREQASKLTAKQREAVAEFITDKPLKITVMPKDAYTTFSFNDNHNTLYDYSGWGGNLEGTGFRTTDQAGVTSENVSSLHLKWAFAFPDASEMRSKPAIAGDWVIIGSQSGEVYALNKETGKIGWQVTATQAIRSGIVVDKTGGSVTAYFADASTYVYAVDVKTGKVLWSSHAGIGPFTMNTGTVAVYDKKVFVPISSFEVAVAADSSYNCCTSSGGVAALDSKTGELLWFHRVITDTATRQGNKKNGKPFYGPSGAPVWCSPTVDVKRKLLYIGSGENYSEPTTLTSDAIQALDITTGKLVWNFQATQHDAWNIACPVLVNCPDKAGHDLDFGMAPILVTGQDRKERLVVGQKSGMAYALSPDDGKLLWKARVGRGGALGGIHWGMAADGKNVYAANADNMFGINPDDSTIKRAPGMFALNIVSGKVIWTTPSPPVAGKESYLAVNSAAPAVIPGVVFAGSNDGHLRAYSSESGKILWDFNTIQNYKSVTGVDGHGGSIDCTSPVLSNGMLFINSGYNQFGEKPGNVLLAFEVKK